MCAMSLARAWMLTAGQGNCFDAITRGPTATPPIFPRVLVASFSLLSTSFGLTARLSVLQLEVVSYGATLVYSPSSTRMSLNGIEDLQPVPCLCFSNPCLCFPNPAQSS